jgi:hypothetical protein
MRRLDWQLVRPPKDGKLSDALGMAEIIRRLVHREARGLLSAEDQSLLLHSEDTYTRTTLSTCKAVGAPVVDDDPHWQTRIIDEFSDSDAEIDLAEYLELRSKEPDCERCPYTSPYSLFPMDPCEFSAGALEVVLLDVDIWEQARQRMDPAAMRALAGLLDQARIDEEYRSSDAIDSADYLLKASYFLTFWADIGFGILPIELDDLIDFGGPDEGIIVVNDGDSSEPTTLH